MFCMLTPDEVLNPYKNGVQNLHKLFVNNACYNLQWRLERDTDQGTMIDK